MLVLLVLLFGVVLSVYCRRLCVVVVSLLLLSVYCRR